MKLRFKSNKTAKELWYMTCRNQVLSEDFMRKHKDELAWDQVSFHQKMSIEFAEEFRDRLWWDAVNRNTHINEQFIRHFYTDEDILHRYMRGMTPETDKTKMGRSMAFRQMWFDITKHHRLSEEFIREFRYDVDWDVVSSSYEHLSQDFIREFKDRLRFDGVSKTHIFKKMKDLEEFADEVNWDNISRYQTIEENFIRKWSEKLNIKDLFFNSTSYRESKLKVSDEFLKDVTNIFADVDPDFIISFISTNFRMAPKQVVQFIEAYKDKINWSAISRQHLPIKFIEKHANELDWGVLSAWQKFTQPMIEKYKNKLDWNQISMNGFISDEIIINNIDKFSASECDFMLAYRQFKEDTLDIYPIHGDGWRKICEDQHLSEDFIRKHIKNISWTYIVQYQKLSENFIREFADKLDWGDVSTWQKLSEKFIWEFRNKLDLVHVLDSNKLSEKFIEKLVKEYE